MPLEQVVEGPLTPREQEVVYWTAEGKTMKDIASILGLSTKTIDCHRTRIADKLNISGPALLTRWAIRNGLLEA